MTTNTNTNTNTINLDNLNTWAKISDKIYGLRREVKTSYRVHAVHLRIDGRSGSYRVDRSTLLGLYWEAIDGGEGFATIAEAKKFVTRWVRAARAQGDITPRL